MKAVKGITRQTRSFSQDWLNQRELTNQPTAEEGLLPECLGSASRPAPLPTRTGGERHGASA